VVDQKVRFIAELLDLTSLLKKFPGSLAGGQQQRVSLARAFVRQPNLTLLDEPISHMDQRVRAEIRARIRHLHDEMKNTTVYVTHDQAEAVSLCDRMVILHQARLQQIGTVEEIWNRPANRFVAHFVGEPAMNFVPCGVETPRRLHLDCAPGGTKISFTGEVEPSQVGAGATLGFRPQEVKVARVNGGANTVPCTVRIAEFQGENTVLTMSVAGVQTPGFLPSGREGEADVKAVVPATDRFREGERVWLSIPVDSIHLFQGEVPILRRAAGQGA